MSAQSYRNGRGVLVWAGATTNKTVDTSPERRANLPPEQREYYLERRRALLTELKALNKLLGIKSE